MTIYQNISDQDFHLSHSVQRQSSLRGKILRSDLLSLKNVHRSHTLRMGIVLHHDSMVYLNLPSPKRTRLTYVENMASIHSACNSFRKSQSSPEIGQMPHRAQNLSYGQHRLSIFFRLLCHT